MMTERVRREIARLEAYNKQGESYSDGKGRYGWRNPIRGDTGGLLQALVVTANPDRMLEIGTAHGLSALYLISGARAGATLDTIEFDEEVAADTQLRMDACNMPVTVCCGEALDVINRLEGRYDLVFFDAQKNQYKPQLERLLARELIGSGTVVLADNVIDRAEECAAFLKWFSDHDIPHQIIETECGLLVAKLP
jgi:predicted O-methyltransferase YrrM